MDKQIRASIGSLGVLGLRNIKLPAPPTTLYLMVGERCMFDCAYCPQAKNSHGSTDFLSRVIWPKTDWQSLKKAVLNAPEIVKRVCFQVVSSEGYIDAAEFFVRDLSKAFNSDMFKKDTFKKTEIQRNLDSSQDKSSPSYTNAAYNKKLPISVSIRLSNMSDVERIFNAGAERIGLAMDVVSRKYYASIRGGNFSHDFQFILDAGKRFPNRITTHVIVGMGETDRELFEAFAAFYERNITVGLFAFTPIKGTRMENAKRPELTRYRKIQFMRYLFATNREFVPRFDQNDALVAVEGKDVGRLVQNGAIYLTSGCPNCNRPYYNEEPLGPMFNYPFIPEETARIVSEFAEKIEKDVVIFK